MRELWSLSQQCEDVEKLVQDIIIEVIGCGNDTLIELTQELGEEVIELSRKIDEAIEYLEECK